MPLDAVDALAARATQLDEDIAVLELVAADPTRLEHAWDWPEWLDDAAAVVERRAGAEAAESFRAGCEKRDTDSVGRLVRQVHADMLAEDKRRAEADLEALPEPQRKFFEPHDPYLYARQRRTLAHQARANFAATRAEHRTRTIRSRGPARRYGRQTRTTRRAVRGRVQPAHGPPRPRREDDSDHDRLAADPIGGRR